MALENRHGMHCKKQTGRFLHLIGTSLQKSVFAGNSLMSVPDYRIMHVRDKRSILKEWLKYVILNTKTQINDSASYKRVHYCYMALHNNQKLNLMKHFVHIFLLLSMCFCFQVQAQGLKTFLS